MYVVYGGNLYELRQNLKENQIFNTLEEFTIPFNCTIKDGKMLIRVNRSSNGKYAKESTTEYDKLHYKEIELRKSLQSLSEKKKEVLDIMKSLQSEIVNDFFNKDITKVKAEQKSASAPGSEQIKRKKGRPRKYPLPAEQVVNVVSTEAKTNPVIEVVVKKKRGRKPKPKILTSLGKDEATNLNKQNEDESTKNTDEGISRPKRKYTKRKNVKVLLNNQEIFIFPIGPTSVFKRRKKYIKNHLKRCIKNKSDFRVIKKASPQLQEKIYKRKLRRLARKYKSKL